jgi:hypothetical protein
MYVIRVADLGAITAIVTAADGKVLVADGASSASSALGNIRKKEQHAYYDKITHDKYDLYQHQQKQIVNNTYTYIVFN